MEGVAQICKFHKRGHCKFGHSCRHFHSDTICSTDNCDNTCQHRHPKACLYHLRFGRCKFGTRCSYLHPDLDERNCNLARDVEELKKSLQQVVRSLKTKENEIRMLEAKVHTLEAAKLNKVQDNHLCSPEQERNWRIEDSLHLSPIRGDRKETFSSQDSSPLPADSNQLKCEYWLCDYEASSESNLKKHVKVSHTIDMSFKYPNSTEKVICDYDQGPQDLVPECEQCGKEFFLDHNFAMHLFYSHKVGYECAHCRKYFPGGDEMYRIHMKLCTSPCPGDSHCPCRLY